MTTNQPTPPAPATVTPRTDAYMQARHDAGNVFLITADFARTLETELTAAKESENFYQQKNVEMAERIGQLNGDNAALKQTIAEQDAEIKMLTLQLVAQLPATPDRWVDATHPITTTEGTSVAELEHSLQCHKNEISSLRDTVKGLRADGAASAFVDMAVRASEAEQDRDTLAAENAKLRGLLEVAKCPDPNCDGEGSTWMVEMAPHGEPMQVQTQCQWCCERAALAGKGAT